MIQQTVVTPLNCAFGVGLNSMMKMEQSEYDAATDRAIYCKSPDLSWFKMKTVQGASSYLEPTIYDVAPGDIIEVEFEAMRISSGDIRINLPVLKIQSDYVTTTATAAEASKIQTSDLTTYFKKYKLRCIVPLNHDGLGVVLNMRPNIGPSEIIIKNISIKVDSSVHQLGLKNNIVEFKTRTDYMKCVDFYSGTNLNPTYQTLKAVFDAGTLLFPNDETMEFRNAGTTNFKGLMSLFNGHTYRPTIAIYAEYTSPVVVSLTAKSVKEDSTFSTEGSNSFPVSTTMRKALLYFTGSADKSRKTFVDIGMVGSGQSFTLKNVRMSIPQFDAQTKRDPNQLEELYTNLRLNIR